jgi:hypothetical protein
VKVPSGEIVVISHAPATSFWAWVTGLAHTVASTTTAEHKILSIVSSGPAPQLSIGRLW